jgi:hypothetical protein
MDAHRRELLRLIAQNDQLIAEADDWIREAEDAEELARATECRKLNVEMRVTMEGCLGPDE